MSAQTKKCSKCSKILDVSQFHKDSSNSNGLSYKCRICKLDDVKVRCQKRKTTEIEIPKEKTCPHCKKTLSSDNFYKTKTNHDGLSVYCKICRLLMTQNQEKTKKDTKIVIDATKTKKCSHCNIEKPLTSYKTNLGSSDNLFHICTDCLPKNNFTIDKQRAYDKKYREAHPERIKEKNKRQALNINRRIRTNINKRVREMLMAKKLRKDNKTITYIGCGIVFFKNWIESQFNENISWDNYGKWHLDHVKPCSSYDFTKNDQVHECFNWKNYQPLMGQENLIKSDKIDQKLIDEHLIKANKYEQEHIKPL